MYTDRTNKLRLTLSSRCISTCLLYFAGLARTHAKPIFNSPGPQGDDKTNTLPLIRRGDNLKILSREVGSSLLARDQFSASRSGDVGAIVGGTIAASIILGLALFVYVRIYEEFIIRRHLRKREEERQQQEQEQQHNQTPTPAADKQSAKGYWDVLPDIRTSFSSPGQFLEKWGRRKNGKLDSRYSGLEFGDLNATPPMGSTEPIAGPSFTPKAASVLGVEPNMPSPVPLAVPSRSLTPVVPFAPMIPPTPRFNPGTPLPRRNSGGSMSTLGRELYQDTMLPPAPAKFSSPPVVDTALPPEPLSPESFCVAHPMSQDSDRRYFLPGKLQTPTSPGAARGIERLDFQRDRYKGTRYSMGDNVI